MPDIWRHDQDGTRSHQEAYRKTYGSQTVKDLWGYITENGKLRHVSVQAEQATDNQGLQHITVQIGPRDGDGEPRGITMQIGLEELTGE